jgi:hypothetical protein
MIGRLPVPRQVFADLIVRLVGDAREDITQIGFWLRVVCAGPGKVRRGSAGLPRKKWHRLTLHQLLRRHSV